MSGPLVTTAPGSASGDTSRGWTDTFEEGEGKALYQAWSRRHRHRVR